MLREVRLRSFKCFESANIPLGQLTLLTGCNGAGKSTVAQALLLLHQALADALDGGSRTVLPLNGPAVSLGTVRDVVDEVSGASSFEIGVQWDGVDFQWGFRAENAREVVARVLSARWGAPHVQAVEVDEVVRLIPDEMLASEVGTAALSALAQLCYVPADRIGPSEVYVLDDPRRHKTFGARASLAIGNLYWRREDDVCEPLRHPNPSHTPKLPRQVEAWLSELCPGSGFDIQAVPNANLVRLALRTDSATGFHRPQHVGFGLSHVMPVLIALVGGKPGDVVVLDSPEAHLHPKAQATVGRLCARTANAGIQVIVETHSDHVVNGIRVAVRDGLIRAEDVRILFFGVSRQPPVSIRMDGRGGLENWPAGFLDESERLLDRLLEQ